MSNKRYNPLMPAEPMGATEMDADQAAYEAAKAEAARIAAMSPEQQEAMLLSGQLDREPVAEPQVGEFGNSPVSASAIVNSANSRVVGTRPAPEQTVPVIEVPDKYQTAQIQAGGRLVTPSIPLAKTRYGPQDRIEQIMHHETRDAVMAQPRFGIMLRPALKDQPNYIDVKINGLSWIVKRNEFVEVPQAVYLQLVEAGEVAPQRPQDRNLMPSERLREADPTTGRPLESVFLTGDGETYGTPIAV